MLTNEQKIDLRDAIASSNCERSALSKLMKDLSADNKLAIGFINQYKANLAVEEKIHDLTKYQMTAYDWYLKQISPEVPIEGNI